MTRGMKGCYVYFCDKELEEYFRKRITKKVGLSEVKETKVIKLHVTPSIRIEANVNDDVKYADFLPLYSLKAACGAFGEYQTVSEKGWIKVEGVGRLNRSMFVIQAIGR